MYTFLLISQFSLEYLYRCTTNSIILNHKFLDEIEVILKVASFTLCEIFPAKEGPVSFPGHKFYQYPANDFCIVKVISVG